MIRLALGIPLILAGEAVTTIGYALAGSPHLNPHRRR